MPANELSIFPNRLMPGYYEEVWPKIPNDERIRLLTFFKASIKDYHESIADGRRREYV